MKKMFRKINESAREAGKRVRKAAHNFGDLAREKAMLIIEGWVEILPKIETFGLQITSFGLTMGLNPCLQIELTGSVGAMTPEKIEEILVENAENQYIKLVFQAIRTTVSLHARTNASPIEPLLVCVLVKLSPEITVFVGQPVFG